MANKYHAINIANGMTLALIDVTSNPNDDSQIVATITSLSFVLQVGTREKVLCDTMAMVFPFGTADIYIAKNLLCRIGVPKEEIGTQIKYIRVAA